MKTELPERIEVTFTEEDRCKAEDYNDHENCLMATALKRMGYNHDTPILISGCGITYINKIQYLPLEDTFHYGEICNNRSRKPFYKESVVGKTVKLVKSR